MEKKQKMYNEPEGFNMDVIGESMERNNNK